ncbi:MAG: type I-D CRISPR-associated protein Cas7/Csc2 [Ruminiclostridium sp.]|nr:type I-D CRISPR-associated protein Cas7/Csc2 [Ruminiclostridium sp.]
MNNIETFKELLKDFTLPMPENKPKENYVNILVLRELKSAARFTTDGVEANSAIMRIGSIEETVGKMFGRKQVASDRRKAKALQRTLISEEMKTAIGDEGWNGCTMKVNDMCQKCPECALFGSAASEESISITSRVMYDEAYTIRALNAIVQEYFQNAPGDDYSKKPTPGIREPDFFKEGTLFPCVITLRDVTAEELLFFLNITDRNSRYGATTTRFGKVQNHILGVYASHREGPSSLEVTRNIALKLAGKIEDSDTIKNFEDKLKKVMFSDTLHVDEIKKLATESYEEISNNQRINYLAKDILSTSNAAEHIEKTINATASNPEGNNTIASPVKSMGVGVKFNEISVSIILKELNDDVVKSLLVVQIDKIKNLLNPKNIQEGTSKAQKVKAGKAKAIPKSTSIEPNIA